MAFRIGGPIRDVYLIVTGGHGSVEDSGVRSPDGSTVGTGVFRPLVGICVRGPEGSRSFQGCRVWCPTGDVGVLGRLGPRPGRGRLVPFFDRSWPFRRFLGPRSWWGHKGPGSDRGLLSPGSGREWSYGCGYLGQRSEVRSGLPRSVAQLRTPESMVWSGVPGSKVRSGTTSDWGLSPVRSNEVWNLLGARSGWSYLGPLSDLGHLTPRFWWRHLNPRSGRTYMVLSLEPMYHVPETEVRIESPVSLLRVESWSGRGYLGPRSR